MPNHNIKAICIIHTEQQTYLMELVTCLKLAEQRLADEARDCGGIWAKMRREDTGEVIAEYSKTV
jgi:hypothetical protein